MGNARQATPKQRRFAEEYATDFNATRAARAAGYKTNWGTIGYQLLQKKPVQAILATLMADQSERTGITADRVLTELYRLAMVDVAEVFDEHGALRPLQEMSEDARRAISGIEMETIWEGHGKDRTAVGTVAKVKLWNKVQALELLGKNLRLWREIVEHTGSVDIIARLQQARNRSQPLVPTNGEVKKRNGEPKGAE